MLDHMDGWKWKTSRGSIKTKDLLKSVKRNSPFHITPLRTITRAEICRPGVAIQQTFRFIASAAAPLGLRLIAGWIKPQWLTDELRHWRDMREMNVEQFKVKFALATLNSSKESMLESNIWSLSRKKYDFSFIGVTNTGLIYRSHRCLGFCSNSAIICRHFWQPV